MNAPRKTAAKAPTQPSRQRRSQAPAKGGARSRQRVDVALQGGGSHGAFTWGVLDRLLEPDGLDLAAISGTSAGAMNGAVMLTGHVRGHERGGTEEGRAEARRALDAFWRDVSQGGPWFTPMVPGIDGQLHPAHNLSQWPGFQWLDLMTRAFSPYDLNPLNINPLKQVMARHVDVDLLHRGCEGCGAQLFVTATSVVTGRPRVFTEKALSLDAIMASACLPFMFQAVEIDGEGYWDGGYTGNPALFPLIYDTASEDILLVKINPIRREGTPQRSADIIDRLSEITFNTSLIGEMRAIAFVKKLIREGRLDRGNYKDLRMHMIGDDEGLAPFNASSKSNTGWTFLLELKALGRRAAEGWLSAHREDVGVRSSLDIEATFLGLPSPDA